MPVFAQLKGLTLDMVVGDQGWGNLKGQVELKLCRGEPNGQQFDEWNEHGAGWNSHVVWREPVVNVSHNHKRVTVHLDTSSEFIRKFHPGDYFELH